MRLKVGKIVLSRERDCKDRWRNKIHNPLSGRQGYLYGTRVVIGDHTKGRQAAVDSLEKGCAVGDHAQKESGREGVLY